jgi:PAS domain S-box-containing protein
MPHDVAAESDFRGFFQISNDLMLICGRDAVFTDLNEAWFSTLGWNPSELIGTSFVDLIHPDDLENSYAAYQSLLDGSQEKIIGHETRFRCHDGTYRWTEWTAGRLGNSLYAIGRDITLLKTTLGKYAESLEVTKAIFDTAVDSIVVVGRDLTIIATSGSSEQIHGHPSSERLNHNLLDLVHPDDCEHVASTFHRAIDDGSVAIVNFRIRHLDGHYVSIEARGRALRNDHGPATSLIFIARDVTESNAAKAALTESLETTRAIFDSVADGIIMINREFQVVESNLASTSLFGATATQRSGQASLDVVHPDDLLRVFEAGEEMFATGEIVTVRYRVLREDGSGAIIESRGRSLHNPIGPPALAVFIARDVTESVQAEEALATSLETTRAILEAAPDSIIMIDSDYVVLDASPSTLRIFGLTPDDRRGTSALDVVHPDDRERVDGVMRRFFNDGEKTLLSIRFRAVHHDGHSMSIEARGLLWPDVHGRPPRAVLVARDISASVIAEADLAQSVALTGAILEAAPDSIVTIGRDLIVIDASPGTERMYGIPRADRIGTLIYSVVHPDDQSDVVTWLHQLFQMDADDTITIRYRGVDASGVEKTMEARGRRLRTLDDHEPKAVVVSRDISEEFAAQAAMKVAKEAAEQSNLAKSEFMSRMSHELRTPLNSVLGFSQILQMELDSVDQLELVDHIFKSGTHLLDLIDEVLDISRVESGHITISLESVSIQEVVDECVRIITPQASDAGVALVIGNFHDLQVLADRQRLIQVLLNLMSNAVKFNSEAGKLTVNCALHEGRVRMMVTDSGAGIEPEMLSRLFTAFDRLDADARGIEGTGLGLALSKSLIEAIGGTIGVESIPHLGSTFWIELPATDVPQSIAPTSKFKSSPPVTPLPEATVLYIEDNVANVHLVERLMASRTTVHLVTSLQGGLGIELAQQLKPALILLDVHLPDLHGFEVLRRLRSDDRTEGIPIVVLSADATEWQTSRFLEAGANDYLTKPFDLHRLLDVLDDYLGAVPTPAA